MAKKGKSKSKQRKAAQNNTVIKSMLIVGVVLFLGAAFYWLRLEFNDPRRVFNGMLENSLRTRSFSKTITQEGGGQRLDQNLQLRTGETAQAHAVTVLSQGEAGSTSVRTETIGTPRIDYVRYTDIKTDQVSINGQPFDFSQVVGIWGKSERNEASGGGELFSETLLGVIPIGYIPHDARQGLLDLIRNKQVYDVNYGRVKREIVNGRPVYTFPVSVTPETYVEMLKEFGKGMGLRQLESVDPKSFANSPALQFDISVDVWSRQLTNVKFLASPRNEVYSGFGHEASALIPEETIPVEELQNRLQMIQ